MKIAIVGTSHLEKIERVHARSVCAAILKSHEDPILISGDAYGIDCVADEIAHELDIPSSVFPPEGKAWEWYKKRNMTIARLCDKLYCITTKVKTNQCYHHAKPMDHQKTAGCWTMNEAKLLNKHTKLVIL